MANITIPRPEYPLPQWERTHWTNLNGKWEFDFDFGKSALERGLQNVPNDDQKLPLEINVPFCPEMRKLRHPFDRGIGARKGIEF